MKSMAAARRNARRFALQSLYQMAMTGDSAGEVVHQFLNEQQMQGADLVYYEKLVRGVDLNRQLLLSAMEPLLDRSLTELDPVETSVMLVGAYELVFVIEIPFRVVISEAVELAKQFGATDGYRYVNSILDGLAKQHRLVETQGL